jgi:hypothetical protein
MTHAFFIPDGDGFHSAEFTRGPWSPKHQHGGPSAALMARAVEQAAGGMHVARLTVEFLRPIPIERLTLQTEFLQKGRKVQWINVTLKGTSSELARARAVCIRRADFDLKRSLPESGPPSPEASRPIEFPFFEAAAGYHTAMELRFARGEFGKGDVAAWMRMRCALVAGEKPSPLQRVIVAADSGNGVSACLDWEKWTFVNPDLTVSLHRIPEGEWICLEAITRPDPGGVGLSETCLWDVRGPIGRAVQSLLIDRRNRSAE